MKNLLITILIFILIIGKANSQVSDYKAIDFALAIGNNGFSPALGYQKLYGIGKSKKFKIGYGIRYTGFFANDKNIHFRTAPASLTSGKASLVALFSEDIVNQIDTLHMNKVNTNAINLNIHLEYTLTKKLDLGFNIDAIGFTFGKKQNAQFIASETDSQGAANNNKYFTAKPTAFNLLLISDSDIGSLNSEMYARYWASPKTGLRVGASFQFFEYTTSQKLAFDNDRFRSKQLMPFIALTFKL